MSKSGGLKPRAVAGRPSVTKLTHRSWTGISASGRPRAAMARPSSTAATMEEKLSSANTISEADFATAVPEPIAIPISAFFKAGASFTPSPVCRTGSTREKRRALAQAAFCSDVGRSSNSRPEYDLPVVSSSSPKTPIRRQMASAVALLSPVITITRMPAARHLAIESNTSLRGGSSMPTTPINWSRPDPYRQASSGDQRWREQGSARYPYQFHIGGSNPECGFSGSKSEESFDHRRGNVCTCPIHLPSHP
ncbi:hypothetical protein ALC60_04838 [Trachymyrmex zeteki]|uniref:Uncharacterized protein n=1 Tax=Mycetomoellerius zeteki TaxID=64791 RepID=A0A151X7C2_9HYME|nr:hypothetical protein ALC60_04838 [Trachymyrmex zeteki]